jgi:hypothetical protein
MPDVTFNFLKAMSFPALTGASPDKSLQMAAALIERTDNLKSTRPFLIAPALTLDLIDHVVDHKAVFMLRAEHDDFRVRIDLNVVPRGPVEKVIRFDCLLRTFRIGGGELAVQDETPVRTLAHIAFQPLEQRGRVHAHREREKFSADLP